MSINIPPAALHRHKYSTDSKIIDSIFFNQLPQHLYVTCDAIQHLISKLYSALERAQLTQKADNLIQIEH